MVAKHVTGEDIARIEQAVMAAEAQTSAEIRVVLLKDRLVSPVLYVLAVAACGALILPWPLVLRFPAHAVDLFAAQIMIFVLLGAVLIGVPRFARMMIPRGARKAAARAAALDRFLALGIHLTPARTGIMILVALEDRLVEVVADEGVMRQMGEGLCAEVCSAVSRGALDGDVASGIVAGVELCGARLSKAFPQAPGERNVLPDHVVLA
ncbi:TPM domain-containing protein [Xanthobacteraceae bacterium A53D]